MMRQQLLPIGIVPPRPTIRDEAVAKRIAERIVSQVNLDDFYWEPREIPDRVWDIQHEIMAGTPPACVIERLYWKQPPFNDLGQRGGHPYGWEGIDEYCRDIADDIAAEELKAAVRNYRERWGYAALA